MLDNSDFEWLKANYPGVYFVPSKNLFQGCLWFRMSYSMSVRQGIINPDEHSNFKDGYIIEDAYEIRFEVDELHLATRVWEDGGRIIRTKNKWQFSLSDVHMYKDGSLCLCPKPEEKLLFHKGFKLSEYFYRLLIPYFYYQSYLERFGREPWMGSSHGDLGILESYYKQNYLNLPLSALVNYYTESLSSEVATQIASKKKINRNVLCVCRSGRRFRDCHPIGFEGMSKLHADYLTLKTVSAVR